MERSRVALVRGESRYHNVMQALDAIADDIQVAGKERIVIKPNFVSVRKALSATHADAVRAVLDFLRSRGVERATLAEGPAGGLLAEALREYGYLGLVKDYHLETVDLNHDQGVAVELYDRGLRPLKLKVARTIVESDFRISVCPPKTHDTVIVTLSLKNMAVGSLVAGDKSRVHQGYPAINLNLYKLAPYVAPHLAILDGFRAMEGSGPTDGDPVDWKVAIASSDFLAADSLAAQLMGFTLEEVGYLYYSWRKGLGKAKLEEMELCGNIGFDGARRQFQPHPTRREQLAWKLPDFERYL